MANTTHDEDDDGEADTALTARRDALKKIGLAGAYATPVMIAILKSEKALAASGGSGCPPAGCPIEI